MAVARKVAVINDVSVALPSFSFPGMPIGFIVCDTTGQNWQLTVSTAVVDHTTTEKVIGNPQLRWLTYSGGGGLTPIADQTTLANVSGASAIPTATSATAMRTMLDIQASSAVAITGGTITGTTLALAPAQLSDGPLTVTGATGVLANPVLTGLTATAATLKNDLITGKTGGQTLVGDTASSGNMTYFANAAGRNGQHIFGATSIAVINEGAGTPSMTVGLASPQGNCVFEGSRSLNGAILIAASNPNTGAATQSGFWALQRDDATLARGQFTVAGSGFTTSGVYTAGTVQLAVIGGSGNLNLRIFQAAGDLNVTTTTSDTVRFTVTNAGNVTTGTGLATTAVDGFLYVPSGAGPPTGVPTSPTLNNNVPLYVDRTNHKLYMYIGGWLGGTAPGAFT